MCNNHDADAKEDPGVEEEMEFEDWDDDEDYRDIEPEEDDEIDTGEDPTSRMR